MNSNAVKPERFDHLHSVYNFTVPLRKSHKRKSSKPNKRSVPELRKQINIELAIQLNQNETKDQTNTTHLTIF